TAVFLFNYLDRAATAKTMAEVGRVLRAGGRFIFAVPHPSLAFLRAEERPFYFSRGEHGYISGRDVQFEGKIWRRDGEAVQVRCVHKTLDDYFVALKAAGFKSLPDLKELHATDEHIAFDPEFFEPLRDQPLHLAFRLRWDG
ncbi:MAG: class I SAM-dependent methyltransferase, partial [Planctomycetota bacterium]